MNPDELHEIYHRMAPETKERFEQLENRMNRHETDSAKFSDGLAGRILSLEKEKMGKNTFWTVIGILIAYMTGMTGWLISEIKSLNVTVQETREKVVTVTVSQEYIKSSIEDIKKLAE